MIWFAFWKNHLVAIGERIGCKQEWRKEACGGWVLASSNCSEPAGASPTARLWACKILLGISIISELCCSRSRWERVGMSWRDRPWLHRVFLKMWHQTSYPLSSGAEGTCRRPQRVVLRMLRARAGQKKLQWVCSATSRGTRWFWTHLDASFPPDVGFPAMSKLDLDFLISLYQMGQEIEKFLKGQRKKGAGRSWGRSCPLFPCSGWVFGIAKGGLMVCHNGPVTNDASLVHCLSLRTPLDINRIILILSCEIVAEYSVASSGL